MSTADDSAALAEIRELVTFLGHQNAQVRLQASKMVTSLSALESNRRLIAQTDLIKALGPRLTDSKEIARECVKSMINFGESEELTQQMLRAHLIGRVIECLRDAKTGADLEMRELLLMFLVNATRDEKGAAVLMQTDEASLEGLHVRRLFNWFVQFVPTATNKSQLDPNAYCAHILTNISQIPEGRRLILNRERGFLEAIKPQFTCASSMRRMGVFQLVKNCFMEEAQQSYLLSRELGLWPLILAPIIGSEPFLHGPSEYAGILPEIRQQMTPDKRRDPDPQIRCLVYEILLLCARYKPSRVLLKSQAIYPILRHAHDQEKELDRGGELDDMLENLVPWFILDEDAKDHPDAIAEEKRKARIEQVKQLNAGESETTAAAAAAKKPAAEAADQPVHYLGDEIGDKVRASTSSVASLAAASNSSSSSSSGVVIDEVAALSGIPTRPPVKASAALPVEPIDDDEEFPAIEAFGAEESAQLGELTHNIKTLEVALAEKKQATTEAAAPKKEVVYAQPEAADDEDEEDQPPPLADEADYMNGMD